MHLRRGFAILTLVALGAAGCASRAEMHVPPPAAPSTGVPSAAPATAPQTQPPASPASPAGVVITSVPRPVSTVSVAELHKPYTPGPDHSPIVAVPEDKLPNRRTYHIYRSPHAEDPALELAGPGLFRVQALDVTPAPLAVRTAPGAHVAFYAASLGTFANGREGIVVTADDTGLARVSFRAGQDYGPYDVLAVSPVRSGIVTFKIEAAPRAVPEKQP